MKIALLANDRSGKKTVADVKNALESLGARVLMPRDPAFPPKDGEETMAAADLVISVGGDGTLIHVAKRAAALGKAVLGINGGRLGYMTGMEAGELSRLLALIKGEYTVQSRMMLEVTVEGAKGQRTFTALNEAVISRGSLSRMVELQVGCNGRPVVSYRADGVIVATPTGSTAYSLSAGGPVVDPAVPCMLLTPICPHSLHTRPFIFDAGVTLSVTQTDGNPLFLTVDGEEEIPLEKTDRVLLRRGKTAASIIRLDTRAFHEVLEQKLMDR